jgi:hypothetical protein
MIGPMPFGPGTQTGGSCDFRSSLSRGVVSRMGVEVGMKALALDLGSAKSEFENNNIVDMFRFKVADATFRNKATGQVVTQKTLISPDFNDEAIGVWTDAGENGTGSAFEYETMLIRASAFAQTNGEASLFFVSPGTLRKDGKPAHRAYVWKKDTGGNVTAFAYQLTGNVQTLETMLQKLSGVSKREKGERIDPYTIFWNNDAQTINHTTIFQAFSSSLSEKQKVQSRDFLTRFEKEVQLSDDVRHDRIEKYSHEYDAKLQQSYAGDIEAALEKASGGLIALFSPESFRFQLSDQRKQEIQERTRFMQEKHIQVKPAPVDNVRIKQEQKEKPIAVRNLVFKPVKKPEKPIPVRLEREEENTVPVSLAAVFIGIIHAVQDPLHPQFIPNDSDTLSDIPIQLSKRKTEDPLVSLIPASVDMIHDMSHLIPNTKQDQQPISFVSAYVGLIQAVLPEVHPLDTVIDTDPITDRKDDFTAIKDIDDNNQKTLVMLVGAFLGVQSTILIQSISKTEEKPDMIIGSIKEPVQDRKQETKPEMGTSQPVPKEIGIKKLDGFISRIHRSLHKPEKQGKMKALIRTILEEEPHVKAEVFAIMKGNIDKAAQAIKSFDEKKKKSIQKEEIVLVAQARAHIASRVPDEIRQKREHENQDKEKIKRTHAFKKRLSTYLSLYEDNKSSPDSQIIIAAFIHMELKTLNMLSQSDSDVPNTTLSDVSNEIISSIVFVLETKFGIRMPSISSDEYLCELFFSFFCLLFKHPKIEYFLSDQMQQEVIIQDLLGYNLERLLHKKALFSSAAFFALNGVIYQYQNHTVGLLKTG